MRAAPPRVEHPSQLPEDAVQLKGSDRPQPVDESDDGVLGPGPQRLQQGVRHLLHELAHRRLFPGPGGALPVDPDAVLQLTGRQYERGLTGGRRVMGGRGDGERTAPARQDRAELRQSVEPHAGVRGGAQHLLQQHRGAGSAAPGGDVLRVGGEVVVDEDPRAGDPRVREALGRDAEVDPVTGVVLHDVQHAPGPRHRAGCAEDLPVVRRGEDPAGAGAVQHARTDVPGVQRFVPGSAAGQQPHPARGRGVPGGDETVRRVVAHQIRVRAGEAGQRVGHEFPGAVLEVPGHTPHPSRPWR